MSGLRDRLASRWAAIRARLPAKPDPEEYRLLVRSLFSSAASIIPAGMAAIATPALCWIGSGHEGFLILTGMMVLIFALRMVTFVRFRLSDRGVISLRRLRYWDHEYFIGATIQSFLLGMTAFDALYWTSSGMAHLVAVGSCIGFASGFVARNAARPTFVLLQMFAVSIPMFVGLMLCSHEGYWVMGLFLALYTATNVAVTFSLYGNLVALSNATKTARKLASELEVQNSTLDSALSHMSHGLAMFRNDLTMAVANERFGELLLIPSELLVCGTNLTDIRGQLIRSHAMSTAQARDISDTLRNVLAHHRVGNSEMMREDGVHLTLTVAPALDGGLLIMVEDSTERQAAAARIEQMARFDDLTGLANRFEFKTRLELACSQLALTMSPFSLTYIDLDNFKDINDNLGHAFGDMILQEVSRRLRDLIGEGDVAARFGGDEFVIIRASADARDAVNFAERIVVALGEPCDIIGKTMHLSASVGVAFAPEDGEDPTELLRHADMALYRAKAAGRSCAVRFSTGLAAAAAERHDLEKDMRGALRRGEFELHYQPVLDLASGQVVSHEGLMRWRHPDRGMVPPNVFIPIAETTGLITSLGAWAFERACRDLADLSDHGSVAVNVSAVQFREPKLLISAVSRAIELTGIDPQRLMIEVTESLLIHDHDSVLDTIRSLRALGLKFSLDDFGTGYSSLSYLSSFPFSQVKVDRGFVQTLETNSASRAIVETVCTLARKLGMQTVVEGVETEAQHAIIRELGADKAQGYLFGRPAPVLKRESLTGRKVA